MTVALGFDNQLLVTRVVPNGAAQAAGLRPGLVVTHIDNKPVDETVIRPVTARNLRPAETRLQARLAAETLLGGPVGGVLRVGYRDEAGQTRTAEITRRAPQGEPVRFGQLPPLYTEFEVRRLDNNSVGYIRFNPFLVPLLEPVKKAVRDLKSQNVRGIILDLRGNHGGVGAMAYGVANSFATKQGTLGTMRMRQGQANFPVFPAPDAFTGPLVILTDEASLSTSEILAGGLQEMGRATIVGRPTGGMVLPSFVERLPGGARLQYAIADFKTPKGVLLEGQGVLPDVPVPLRASELVGGRDPDIEVALAQIRGQQPPPGGAPVAATR
jgi:carboxyl-terminal processing protease